MTPDEIRQEILKQRDSRRTRTSILEMMQNGLSRGEYESLTKEWLGPIEKEIKRLEALLGEAGC